MTAKHIWSAVCITGTVLIILPLLIALMSILIANGSDSGIIGGADWPTFAFVLQKYLWISWVGILTVIVAIIGLLRRK